MPRPSPPGPAAVDGDTLEIHGERIRILDIDAPEIRQKCKAINGDEWKCGQWAANKLAEWIGQLTATCETSARINTADGWLVVTLPA